MSSEGQPTIRLASENDRWEYRVISMDVDGFFGPNIDVNQLGNYLNDVGEEGWELVNITTVQRGQGYTVELLGILKRKKRP